MRRKAGALALGLFFLLLATELSLRLLGAAFIVKARENNHSSDHPLPIVVGASNSSDAIRILCIGNSHTQGSLDEVQSSFPIELERILQKKYPNQPFLVFNAGQGNWNSSEVLESLPHYLETYRPRVVFAMVGEPNRWNYRFFYRHFHTGGFLYDALRWFKVVRLLDLALRFDPRGEQPLVNDINFPALNYPWFEYPMLAMSWTGYLSVHPDLSLVPPSELRVAQRSMARYLATPAGAHLRRLASTLVRLDLFFHDLNSALGHTRTAMAIPGAGYDYYLEQSLRDNEAAISHSRFHDEFAKIREELSRRSPSTDFSERLTRALAGSGDHDETFLRAAVAAAPGNFSLCSALAAAQRAAHRDAAYAKEMWSTCLRENSAAWQGAHIEAELAHYSDADQRDIRRSLYITNAAPERGGHVFGEGTREADPTVISQEEIAGEMSEIERWALDDTRQIVELIQDFGAKAILQTYPRYRISRNTRWPDPILRKVGHEFGVPVLETGERFARLFQTEDSEVFYFKKGRLYQDDHLNQRGNQEVAAMMLEELERGAYIN